jgi:nucleoside-diphosphate-sugar epimerase
METLVVTGAAGFIGGYIVREALASGYKVIGIDNLSKYGEVDSKFIKDKNLRIPANKISQHPVFNQIRPKI